MVDLRFGLYIPDKELESGPGSYALIYPFFPSARTWHPQDKSTGIEHAPVKV